MLQGWMPFKSSSHTKAFPQECCKLSANLVRFAFALRCHHARQLLGAVLCCWMLHCAHLSLSACHHYTHPDIASLCTHHSLLLHVIVASHCFLASTAIDRRPSPSPVSLQQQQQVQQQQAQQQQQQQQLLNQLAGYQEGTCAYCSLL